jgi:transposase
MIKIDQVMELHSQGISIRKIAKLTHLGKTTVHNYLQLKKMNKEIKTREFNYERLKEIRNHRAEGHSVRTIAKMMSMSKSNVQYYINKIYDNYESITVAEGATPLQNRIIQFYKDGKSKNEIMSKFNKRLKSVIITEIALLSKNESVKRHERRNA